MEQQLKQSLSNVVMNTALMYALDASGVNQQIQDITGVNTPLTQAISGSLLIQASQYAGYGLERLGLTVIKPKPLGTLPQQVEKGVADAGGLYLLDMVGLPDKLNDYVGNDPLQRALKQSLIVEAVDFTTDQARQLGVLKPVDDAFNSLF